ncbi:thioredoxin family protein [Thermosyntropha sp.]|uniref:TlpA family protein disulfide reductase n=1 Tax=Thermosyntropha sp. TaxID=2740820 RepID=UPI0025F1E3D3|nr:thioredoxin family protein [Thermosyntropha sp.]MBO8158176.1 thioredoxin family protein [Thermosyntropha sp.]
MAKNKNIILILIVVLLLAFFYLYKESLKKENLPEGEGKTAVQEIKEAEENGESMWLLFSSASCPPCVEMKKIFDRIKPEYEGKVRFINISVDEDENYELMREYEIKYIPTIYIIDAKGNVSYHNIGLIEEEALRAELDKVARKNGTVD